MNRNLRTILASYVPPETEDTEEGSEGRSAHPQPEKDTVSAPIADSQPDSTNQHATNSPQRQSTPTQEGSQQKQKTPNRAQVTQPDTRLRPKPKAKKKVVRQPSLRSDVPEDILNWLGGLSEEKRQQQIKEWDGLAEFDFARSCTMIRNQWMMEQLGISIGVNDVGISRSQSGVAHPPTHQPHARRSPSPARRSPSPARRSPSPARRSPSPARRSASPAHRSPSPTQSTGRHSLSPANQSPSPARPPSPACLSSLRSHLPALTTEHVTSAPDKPASPASPSDFQPPLESRPPAVEAAEQAVSLEERPVESSNTFTTDKDTFIPQHKSQVVTSASVGDTRNKISNDRPSWPTWMATQFDFFIEEEMSDDHRSVWVSILSDWVQLERLYAFKGTVRRNQFLPLRA